MKRNYFLVAFTNLFGLLFFGNFVLAQTWTKTSAFDESWTSVASSADGMRLVAVYDNGFIYTSLNAGANWRFALNGGRAWTSVASSSDGTKLVAVVAANAAFGGIWISKNAGTNWIKTAAPSTEFWSAVASSGDGTKLVAAANQYPGGPIYISRNSGTNWSLISNLQQPWTSIAISDDGNRLAACWSSFNQPGLILVSHNGGTTWFDAGAGGVWSSIACSRNGSKFVAVQRNYFSNGGRIYTSGDAGVTWNICTNAPSTNWSSIACSEDGTQLVATVNGGGIYMSTDFGKSWWRTGAQNKNWAAVASSASGNKLVAAVGGKLSPAGGIYTLGTTIITPLRVTLDLANISSTDSVDAPIIPSSDSIALASANTPLGMGLVADGVTPVLFKITGSPGNYTLAISNNAFASNPSFYTNLFVLQNGRWENTTSFSISAVPQANTGTAFVYLQGLDWEQFVNPNQYKKVVATLEAVALTSQNTNSCSFEIRPPPIALIHGYATDARAWGVGFTNLLSNYRPTDFIFPIQYGVAYITNVHFTTGQLPVTHVVVDSTQNTYADLLSLTGLLDELLRQKFSSFQADWACARYDVVGHSQGGVLARMLCQTFANGTAIFSAFTSTPTISQPVVSATNFYRGRFRRVITIGSPHNGSVILNYTMQLTNSSSFRFSMLPPLLGKYIQPKFDPWGSQIALINNPSLPVDPRIKFHCITTTIASGQYPQPGFIPICYSALGLTENGRGQILLPRGSDGIVDYFSQGGGTNTRGTVINNSIATPLDIAHADFSALFGVSSERSQTTLPLVATNVIALLDGPTNSFGSFHLPEKLSSLQKEAINLMIPQTRQDPCISPVPGTLDLSTNYNFKFTAPPGVPEGGTIAWYTQVFGTNGITLDGVSLQVNAANPSLVTVTVTDSAQGTVVLYATYSAASGVLVYANPVVVVNKQVGTSLVEIKLQPPSATLSPGNACTFDMWGFYANGSASILYLPPGETAYFSSNTNVASVDTLGAVTMHSLGSAVITASYHGLTAKTIVASAAPQIGSVFGSIATNGSFQLSFLATMGATNIIEASTNLSHWDSIASFYNISGFIQYQDTFRTNFPSRFYRVMIR